MATPLNTPYATLSFQSLFQPSNQFNEPQAHYEATFLFDPAQQKSPAYKALQDAVIAVAKEKFPSTPLKSLKMPFKDAGANAGKYDGFNVGDTSIKARSTKKPGVVDARLQEILLPDEVWSGQLVRANVVPFAWTHTGRKGVSFGLNHLQIIQSEGRQRLDGRPSAGSAFDDGEVKEKEDIF